MSSNRFLLFVLVAALAGLTALHFRVVHGLRAELEVANEERARLKSELADRIQAATNESGPRYLQLNTEDDVRAAKSHEAILHLPEGEVLRLRGLANRAERAEAEIERLKSGQDHQRAQSVATASSASAQNPESEKLMAFLGEPIAPPSNLDPAYGKEGLINAIQEAAREAGVAINKVEIETSEFPYLAGVACKSDEEFEKLKERFKASGKYEYRGAVSSHGRYAFNITPVRAYPPGATSRIANRSTVRMQLLFSQLESASN